MTISCCRFKILAEHTGAAARALTSMLRFERSLDKELPFDRSAQMLGVVLDLSEPTKGVVKVSNKPSRMAELKEVLSGIVGSGNAGKLALAELKSMEKTDKRGVKLSEVQLGAM